MNKEMSAASTQEDSVKESSNDTDESSESESDPGLRGGITENVVPPPPWSLPQLRPRPRSRSLPPRPRPRPRSPPPCCQRPRSPPPCCQRPPPPPPCCQRPPPPPPCCQRPPPPPPCCQRPPPPPPCCQRPPLPPPCCQRPPPPPPCCQRSGKTDVYNRGGITKNVVQPSPCCKAPRDAGYPPLSQYPKRREEVYTRTRDNNRRDITENVVPPPPPYWAYDEGEPSRPRENDTMTATFKPEDLVKKLRNDFPKSPLLEFVPGQCCIYKVPLTIRRVNEELYTPKLISIGPLHHGKLELVDMENKKKEYMERFFRQTTTEKICRIISFIKDKENQIRSCYTETSPLKSLEFVTMILCDSIFIIEIFLSKKFRNRWDTLLDIEPVHSTLWTDLQLFENQLPYFILEETYKLAFDSIREPSFMNLSDNFFGCFMGVRLSRLPPHLRVKHFTDWRRISLLENYPRSVSAKGWIDDLPCAVKLHESGLKFKSITVEENQSVLDIRYEKSKHLISFFEVNELQIPRLEVNDMTECLLRNIMALEQCLYPEDAQVCNYVELMDCLINTVEDVDLLIENEIISNNMGDKASVATTFNKLNQYVLARPSSYHNICEQLKIHYKNPWNRARATLKRVYFNNPWRGTATIAAIILLLLTIAQTVSSILQVV
ncbi:UPF0481 protein At3g47200-like isoform X2 [Mangifera indica]|nr:UPF0481 protein At3g47200-like isoform X2 [Mangifera indica]XP_044478101.1 UPF0481 protein At3g47200-like isoform X2 [Mangifera indica]